MNNIEKVSAFIVTEVCWSSKDSSPGTKSFWTRYIISLGVWCCLWLCHFLEHWFRYWWLLVQLWSRAGTRIEAIYLHIRRWLFRGFRYEMQVSAVPTLHPSVVSDNLAWARAWPELAWPEFLSAIVVTEGLFVLLGIKKLGSSEKFGLT